MLQVVGFGQADRNTNWADRKHQTYS